MQSGRYLKSGELLPFLLTLVETCGQAVWLGQETGHNEQETGHNEVVYTGCHVQLPFRSLQPP